MNGSLPAAPGVGAVEGSAFAEAGAAAVVGCAVSDLAGAGQSRAIRIAQIRCRRMASEVYPPPPGKPTAVRPWALSRAAPLLLAAGAVGEAHRLRCPRAGGLTVPIAERVSFSVTIGVAAVALDPGDRVSPLRVEPVLLAVEVQCPFAPSAHRLSAARKGAMHRSRPALEV